MKKQLSDIDSCTSVRAQRLVDAHAVEVRIAIFLDEDDLFGTRTAVEPGILDRQQ